MIKTISSRSILVAVLALAALGSPVAVRAEISADVSVGFEAGLAPYGEWITVRHHGRVWRPRHVRAGWRPYFHGTWVWTADGWFWDSEEPWGWAVYHYGRWYPDPVYGWLWEPGTVWAPAWVSWRFGVGAIGWAPLLPGFSVWWTADYPVHYASWCFVPTQRFAGVSVESVAFAPARNAALFSSTRFAPPRSVSGSAPRLGGPPRTFVERQTGRSLSPARMATASSPQAARGAHGAGVVSVYRPAHPGMGRAAPRAATTRFAPHGATTHTAPHGANARAPHGANGRAPQRHSTAPRSASRPAAGARAAARGSPQHAASALAARHSPSAAPARRSAAPRPAATHPRPGTTTRQARTSALDRTATRHASTANRVAPTAARHAPSAAQGGAVPRHEASPQPRPASQPHAPAAAPQPRASAPAAQPHQAKRDADPR